MDAREQFALLQRGTAEILPAEDLQRKLEHSVRTGKPLRVKLGLDPSAPDLHLGFSIPLRKLRQFQDLGHEVVLIIGDFTAMIGDPSGKSETRRPLSTEEVEINARTYAEQYSIILDPDRTRVVFNSQWLGPMTFYDVIHLTSKYTVARLLERDDFAKRMAEGRPIAVHEFLYAFCQAYDSVHLQADVELGGTDQRFNILMARDIQREYGQEPQVAVFMPLLVGLDGVQKMSKSLGNTIGLREPPEEMYAKVMSIGDGLMHDYYEYLTQIPMAEARRQIEADPMAAKRRLAREMVASFHSATAAREAESVWERIHRKRQLPESMPELLLPADAVKPDGSVWLARLLTLAGMAAGTREARRLVEQGGVLVDGQRVTDPDAEIPVREGTVVQVGRRRFVRVAGIQKQEEGAAV
ncbi:MAG: tyrosine--tRNA ligase [Armatimonadetes bacterium]|nr:tyrosine--tRNA ligase [Armatimonadota bacterium]